MGRYLVGTTDLGICMPKADGKKHRKGVVRLSTFSDSDHAGKGAKMKSKENAFSKNIVANKYWTAGGGGGIVYTGGALFDIKEMPYSDKTYRTKLEIFSEYVMNNIDIVRM